MKLKYIKSSLLALVLGTMAIGCQNNDPDDIFGEKPNVRVEKAREVLDNTLLSSEYGWKMMYFTDDTQLGGFAHVIKFDADNKVSMVSDFNATTVNAKESDYTLPMGSTLSLLFATPTHIHELGKGNVFPSSIPKLRGKGYLGDNQFLFVEYKNDNVVLKGNRGFKEITLEKATESDWVLIKAHDAVMKALAAKRTIILIEGTTQTSFNFRFNTGTRWASILNNAQTESVNSKGGVGIGFAYDSITISPAIELEDGTFISELKYENGVFSTVVGDNMIIIN